MIEPLSVVENQPLFSICITVGAFAAASAVWRRSGQVVILNPALTATALVSLVLLSCGMPYAKYLSQAQPISEALPFVIVLFAVPLSRQFSTIRSAWFPIGVSLIAGSTLAILGAVAVPVSMGAVGSLVATLAPKAATAAVAVEISERIGGIGGLTAIVVSASAVFGASFGSYFLDLGGVEDERAKGFALGLAAQAFGTARAYQISDVAGGFAGLGLILNALLTMGLAPLAPRHFDRPDVRKTANREGRI